MNRRSKPHRDRSIDPGLIGLWSSTDGAIVRIRSDGWSYRVWKEPYVISSDGMTLTFPSTVPIAIFQRLYGTGQSLIGVWNRTIVEAVVVYVEELTFRTDGSFGFFWTADGQFDLQGFGTYVADSTTITREERRALFTTNPPDLITLDIPYDADQSGTYAVAADGASWTLTIGATAVQYTKIVE